MRWMRIKAFGMVACAIAALGQIALADSVTYETGGKSVVLQTVPGLFVAGKFNASGSSAPAKVSVTVRDVKAKALIPGLFLISPAGRAVQPKALIGEGAYDFVYPVYQHADESNAYPQPEVIVKIKDGADIFQVAAAYNLSVLRPMLFTTDQFVLRLFPNASPFEVAQQLGQDLNVVWATPNLVTETEKRFKPNDPLYPKQWHLSNTGQFGGKTGADVAAEKAWDLVQPNPNIVIAVVDDAVDISHPDLNIYTNPAEENGQAGIDDDKNGLIDDINGWDFVSNTNDPSPAAEEDNHGTSVAGVAAAIGNNNLGVSGAAPGAKVLALKMMGGGNGDQFLSEDEGTANAIRYAAKYADVMNNSWGGPELSDAVREALDFATSTETKRGAKIMPVLFASGNDSHHLPLIQFSYTLTLDPGEHTVEFFYEKDASGKSGDDQVKILSAEIAMSGEEEEEAGLRNYLAPEAGQMPADAFGDGDVPFEVISYTNEDRAQDYWFQSGKIADDQVSVLVWTVNIETEGEYEFKMTFMASTQADADYFRITVDEEEIETDFESGDASFAFPFSGAVPTDYNVAPMVGENLHPNIINIGASTDEDLHSYYSQWGAGLHFLTPSAGGFKGIYTTDVTGEGMGYDPDSDYTETDDSLFSGTSSSCPLAAGIFALVLSANPELTKDEMVQLFKETAVRIDKYPYDTNGFNPYCGYGRLDMYAAVKRAIEMRSTSVDRWNLY